MDKKTLLAVILSVIVISVGFFIQNWMFPPAVPVATETKISSDTQTPAETVVQEETSSSTKTKKAVNTGKTVIAVPKDLVSQDIKVETNVFYITFTSDGGNIKSLKLKQHKDGDDFVEMINRGDSLEGAFNVLFGSPDSEPVDAVFNYRKEGKDSFVFYRDFAAPGTGDIFTLTKTYTFHPDDYMFELKVTIENSVKEYPSLDFDGYAYTLSFGPQIGPKFEKLDGRREFRQYQVLNGDKRSKERMPKTGALIIDKDITWAAIVGKYFALVGIPDATNYQVEFRNGSIPGVPESSRLYFQRPILKSSKNVDVFRFYAGPKLSRVLNRYDNSDKNGFGIKDLRLNKMVDSGMFGWLEGILKSILKLFYSFIPNYGVAIILLTVVVKIVLFPFTHKSYESTAKMQALNPKVQELRDKYKANPQKMNAEMAALYKREGVSPLGGCLPMLLQMPIFIAMYGLLNKYFDMRGAVFIPSWIYDLSSPESIWNFAPFKLPIVGWSDLRLLPILYVGTQILSSMMMQTPGNSQSQGQMKMMTYLMPVMFFFILYEAPSGLLLYWTLTNLLTALQQKFLVPMLQKRKMNKEKR